jgi:hypothetical protein
MRIKRATVLVVRLERLENNNRRPSILFALVLISKFLSDAKRDEKIAYG